MRVLAISGSLRDGSNNTALLRALREEAPEGVELDIWQGLKAIPAYDQDDDVVPGPEAVEALVIRLLVAEPLGKASGKVKAYCVSAKGVSVTTLLRKS